jgi:hypothetical protein
MTVKDKERASKVAYTCNSNHLGGRHPKGHELRPVQTKCYWTPISTNQGRQGRHTIYNPTQEVAVIERSWSKSAWPGAGGSHL